MTVAEQNILQGECLEVMKTLESGSFDLILVDPPYGTVKGFADSDKVQHGMKGKTGWDTVIDTEKLFQEYNRLLRMNGCLVMFAQEPYTSKLITEAHGNIPFSYRMIWLKDDFSNFLVVNKAPVSYFEDILVFFKKYDTLAQHPIREYSKKVISFIGKNLKQINEDLGHRKAEHFFYVESTQFGLCTKDVYEELCSKYALGGMEGFIGYEELEETDRRFSRRFNLPIGKKYKSNILEYSKDRRGEHPTQKPLELIKDLIETYSNEGDNILDSCMGSGTTLVGAKKLNRNATGVEISPEYCEIARKRLSQDLLF